MKNITITLVFLALVGNSYGQPVREAGIAPPSKGSPEKATSCMPNPSPLKGGGDIFWTEEFDWADSTSQIGWLLPAGWSIEDPDDSGYNWHWAIDSLKGAYVSEPPLNSLSKGNGFLALNLGKYNQDFGNYND